MCWWVSSGSLLLAIDTGRCTKIPQIMTLKAVRRWKTNYVHFLTTCPVLSLTHNFSHCATLEHHEYHYTQHDNTRSILDHYNDHIAQQNGHIPPQTE